MKTILIVKEIRKPNWLYLIDSLAARWKKLGYKVLTHYGAEDLPDADIVILHVDSTIVPDKYAETRRHFRGKRMGGTTGRTVLRSL